MSSDMADSYIGPVRILDPDGVLLTVGGAELNEHADSHSWGGVLRVIPNTGVAGKALRVKLQIPDRGTGEAALDPQPDVDGVAMSRVAGIGPSPL
ncbi:hypothetical protein BH23ACT5_BH23ACT5_04920 [soil metagenome]